jgi:uncharacterized protein (DUF58 family)
MRPAIPPVKDKTPERATLAVPPEILSKIRQVEIKTKKAVSSLFSGEYHSAFKGKGMEFFESRPYQPGDDARSMDWIVTARVGEPFVKTFREERELTMMILFDVSASNSFGSRGDFKSEAAAELCATLAFSALRNNDKVGIIMFTDGIELYVPPRKGRFHALRIIRELFFFKPEGKGTDIAGALDYLNRVMKKRAIVFLVSDFRADGYEKALKATSRKHDLIAVRLKDPMEEALPPAGILAMEDAETGETVFVNTHDRPLMEEFRSSVAVENEERKSLFASAGVDEIVIGADSPGTEPLAAFFRGRQRIRRFG